MIAGRNRQLLVGILVYLAAAGCESEPKPTAFSQQLEQERALAVPTVSGPHEELTVKGELGPITKAIEGALADSKIDVVRTSEPAARWWLLGKSLAGRQVLVEILPILPQRSVVRVTVEGGDLLTRELLKHLASDIANRVR